MPTQIKCPSGLAGEVRGLTVKDGRFLGNKRIARKGKMIDEILRHCWVTTANASVYEFDDPIWDDVLVGDRDYALIKIRIQSLGATTELRPTCDSCEATYIWEIDLDELLDRGTQELTAEARAIFKETNRFPVQVELGDEERTVFHKLAVGKDVRRHLMNRRKGNIQSRSRRDDPDAADDNVLAEAVELRLLEVDGVPKKETRAFLESLSFLDLRRLIHAFDENDCGVNTSIQVECTECGRLQEIDLPFDKDFFFPRLGKPAI